MDEKYVDDNVAGSADKVSAEYEKDPSAAGGEEAWAGKVNDQPSDEKDPAFLGGDDLWSNKDVHDNLLDQKEPAYQSIPVIIISTEGKEEDTIRGLKLGAKGYVKKPFQASELHGLIEKITSG